jgi:putative nucleotidyltransferase with HDIG domain
MALGPQFGRTSSSGRRNRLRRKLPRRTSPLLAWLRDERNASAVLVLAGFVALAAVLVTAVQDTPREFAGQRAERGRVNRLEYSNVDVAATDRKRDDARKVAPRVYAVSADYLERIRAEIDGLPLLVRDKASIAELPDGLAARLELDAESFDALRALDTPAGLASWKEWADRLAGRLATGVPIVGAADFEAFSTAARRTVVVPPAPGVPGDRAKAEPLGRNAIELRAEDPASMRTRLVAEATESGFPIELARTAVTPILADAKPTITFDAAATGAAAQEAADSVEPVRVVHPRGEGLFVAGDLLTPEQVEQARAEHERFKESRGGWPMAAMAAAAAALAGGLALLAAAFLSATEPAAFREWRSLAAIMASALLPVAAAAALAATFPRALAFAAIGAAMLAPGAVTIAFGLRAALMATVVQVALLAGALGGALAVSMPALCAATVYAVLVRDVRHRSTLVTAAIAAAAAGGATMLLAEAATGLHAPGAAVTALGDALIAFVTLAFAGFVVLGLLPAIERACGRATGLTLVELRDPRQPLLRELQRRAPGTWNHSLQVANIAEAAAESIGADGLLAYVGALYHDIGKANKPEYFVENQSGVNRHERLSPAMSLLVIVGHVKDGMELASEYGLPSQVRHFIESHHGTTLMEYFFDAARRRSGDDGINEADFRYPGPKPRTREAAVMMLCDCVESACRTLSEPTPARIEQLVRDLSHRRLVDGQFDSSPLTLRELRSVEDSIIKSLNAIYHGRISYPSMRSGQRDQGGEQPAARTAS